MTWPIVVYLATAAMAVGFIWESYREYNLNETETLTLLAMALVWPIVILVALGRELKQQLSKEE